MTCVGHPKVNHSITFFEGMGGGGGGGGGGKK